MTDRPTAPATPSIGLALGGGGARGYAHLKVIEAFDEMGLRPTVIAGTSIGALIGTAYASGMSAGDVLQRAGQLVGSHRQALSHLFSRDGGGLRVLFDIARSRGSILNAEAVLERVLPDLVGQSFSSLEIPAHIVATDFTARAARAFTSGPLGPALAASIALPGLFSPVEIDGRFHVDGGMTNPLPYDLIHDQCDIVVAVDVTAGRVSDNPRGPSAAEVLYGSIQIMLNALVEANLRQRPPGILIRPPVDRFRVLDLFKLNEIVAAAEPVKDEVKRAIDAALTSAGKQRTGA